MHVVRECAAMHPLFEAHLALEPEETRSLGLTAEGTKDLARRRDALDLYERVLADATSPPALVRVARIALHRRDERIDLERSVFPAWSGTPDPARYLASHEALAREGLARGERPDAELVRHFVDAQLPAIRDAAAPEVRPVWERHLAFVAEELAPVAAEGVWRLGERRYHERLEILGVRGSLAPRAWEVLRDVHARLLETLGVTSLEAARDALAAIEAPRLERPVEAYRAITTALVDFVRERRLARVPDGFTVPVVPVAPGLEVVGHAGNRPAPLLGEGDAAFEVLDDASRHALHWAAPLAVHEGVPGHTLQSAVWQARFRDAGEPPHAFLSVPDPIAAERGDWGAMLAIEGWAVHAEDQVLRAGFHTREGAASVLSFHALRCVRAIADEGLHTGRLDDEAALALYEGQAGMPRAHATRELLRVKRVPTQACTYFAGWQRIAALVAESGLPEADALDRLLAFGPLLPDRLV